MLTLNRPGKPCSKHSGIKAVSYCKKCKRHFCPICEESHNDLFGEDHGDAIDSSYSSEEPDPPNEKCTIHQDYPLDIVCNDCNCKKIFHLHI